MSNEITVEELKVLGFDSAANELSKKQLLKKKLAIAYEHFRFVTIDKFRTFEKELKERTMKATPEGGRTYEKLLITTLKDYKKVPPADVLQALKEAKLKNCFDSYEIVAIQTVEERPDPILFGSVHGCSDSFFIAQWDNDIKIQDILKDNEG